MFLLVCGVFFGSVFIFSDVFFGLFHVFFWIVSCVCLWGMFLTRPEGVFWGWGHLPWWDFVRFTVDQSVLVHLR